MELFDNNDRLSVLPDDVVLSVLERLDDTKSVVRAGVLSKRWKHLPWLLAELNINISAFKHEKSNWEEAMSDLKKAMTAYIQATQSFLATNSTSERKVRTINNLRMVFYLMSEYTVDIISVFTLLRNAIENWSPRHVELEIKVYRAYKYESSRTYASYFMSIGSSVFGLIKKLILNNMRFDESEINLLLQNSKQLVDLEMHCCDCGQGVPYKIDAPESQIKRLKFRLCYFGTIELFRLPKLQELDYRFWGKTSVPLYLGSLPSLKTLLLKNAITVWVRNIMLSEIGLANAPNLEDLVLGFCREKIWLQEETLNQLQYSLSTLNSLTLDSVFVGCDLSWIMLLLEAAPILKRLVIVVCNLVRENTREDLFEVYGEKPESISWKISSFKHYYLEKLLILGIKEDDEPWEFVKLVMERAVRPVNVVFSEQYDKICENDVVKTTHLELFDEEGKRRTVKVARIR